MGEKKHYKNKKSYLGFFFFSILHFPYPMYIFIMTYLFPESSVLFFFSFSRNTQTHQMETKKQVD